jgi:hypothetical protein
VVEWKKEDRFTVGGGEVPPEGVRLVPEHLSGEIIEFDMKHIQL